MLAIFTVIIDVTQAVEFAYSGIVVKQWFNCWQQFFLTRHNLFQNWLLKFTPDIIFFVYENIYFICDFFYVIYYQNNLFVIKFISFPTK